MVVLLKISTVCSANDYDIATKSGYGEVAKLIAENKAIESEKSNNDTKLNHRHTIMLIKSQFYRLLVLNQSPL